MSYQRFFSLFNQARQAGVLPHADHHELVADMTGGKAAGLRELSQRELAEMETRIQELLDPVQASMQRMRRKVIGILAGRGAVTPQGRPDMERIHGWVEKYGYLHKALNNYTRQELPRLVTQAEAVMASDLKAINARHA